MYSTVASLHIALDNRLQQLNSNRKEAIYPEQYDIAINDAIMQYIKSRVSAKLNSKQEGFESSISRYSDLESLKRKKSVIVYNNNNGSLTSLSEYVFDIPSNCYRPISLKSNIMYNKFGLTFLQDTPVTKYIQIFTISDSDINTTLTIKTALRSTITVDFTSLFKSHKSMFYALNLIRQTLFTNGIEVYINNYQGYSKPNSIICYSYSTQIITSVSNDTLENKYEIFYIKNVQNTVNDKPAYVMYNNKVVELTSSENYDYVQSDKYVSKNIHTNPIYKISNYKGIILSNNKFKPELTILEYLKHPTLVNYKLDIMTDIPVTDEILDIATSNLSLYMKDSTYQFNRQKEQINN